MAKKNQNEKVKFHVLFNQLHIQHLRGVYDSRPPLARYVW